MFVYASVLLHATVSDGRAIVGYSAYVTRLCSVQCLLNKHYALRWLLQQLESLQSLAPDTSA